jgi:hypothetical protein
VAAAAPGAGGAHVAAGAPAPGAAAPRTAAAAPRTAAEAVALRAVRLTGGAVDAAVLLVIAVLLLVLTVLLPICSPGATNACDISVCRLIDTVASGPFAGSVVAVAGTGAQGAAGGSGALATVADAWRELPLRIKAANVAALVAFVSVAFWTYLRYRRRLKGMAAAGAEEATAADTACGDSADDDAAGRPRWGRDDAGSGI